MHANCTLANWSNHGQTLCKPSVNGRALATRAGMTRIPNRTHQVTQDQANGDEVASRVDHDGTILEARTVVHYAHVHEHRRTLAIVQVHVQHLTERFQCSWHTPHTGRVEYGHTSARLDFDRVALVAITVLAHELGEHCWGTLVVLYKDEYFAEMGDWGRSVA